MLRETEEQLAGSLTAETTALLPFLPYLLQDFWALGVDPAVVTALVQRHVDLRENTKILDLACGKGAVSVRLAAGLGVTVKGIDLIPAFIGYAEQKARAFGVDALCSFSVGDINKTVQEERGYDSVVYGAVGGVLGDYAETLRKLKATVKPGGFILLDNYDFLPRERWTALFLEAGLELLEAVSDSDRKPAEQDDSFRLISDSKAGMAAIRRRANELALQHPDQRAMFEGYVRSQQREYDEIENQSSTENITWILKKRHAAQS